MTRKEGKTERSLMAERDKEEEREGSSSLAGRRD